MKIKINIIEATNRALGKMDIHKEWGWDNWWEKITGQKAPRNGSIKSFFYVNDRLELKDKINRELAKRRLPNRIFVRRRVGVYMVNEKRVARQTIFAREKKMTACIDRSVNQYYILSEADKMSSRNVALLENKAEALEENKNILFTEPRKLKLIPDNRDFPKEMEALDEMTWILKKAHLTERETNIYIKRVSEGLILEEIGREESLTRERVRQILVKIEKKIQKVARLRR